MANLTPYMIANASANRSRRPFNCPSEQPHPSYSNPDSMQTHECRSSSTQPIHQFNTNKNKNKPRFNNFNTRQNKIQQFIHRQYTNESILPLIAFVDFLLLFDEPLLTFIIHLLEICPRGKNKMVIIVFPCS